MDNRFPAAWRLSKKKDIEAVFARRDVFRGERLVFYRGPIFGGDQTDAREKSPASDASPENRPKKPTTENLSRFCLVVSRKCGKAVRRNRIKRVLREIIRYNRERIALGFDFVVRVECDRLAHIEEVTEKEFIGDFQVYFGWK